MAKRDKTLPYQNPVAKPDPRFQPANDAENQKAHDEAFQDPKAKDEQQERIQSRVAFLINDAIDGYEESLQSDQVKATEYYKGELFGDEKEGRSKVVSTVLRDATLGQMPSLMRIVYEQEGTVEFDPVGPEDVDQAQLQTQYVRHIITKDNPGFRLFWDALMDGQIRRLGIAKAWWDETTRKTQTDYSGLTELEFNVLAQDPDVEIIDHEVTESAEGPTYSCTAVHYDTQGRVCIQGVPNEEWVTTPAARSTEDSRLVAHVREMDPDDLRAILVADGMDPDDVDDLVEKHKGKRRLTNEELKAARQFDGQSQSRTDPDDEEDDKILYAEAYARMSVEEYAEPGQQPELRLFKCMGGEWEIVNGDGLGECTNRLPFAAWTPIPEPHTIVGQSNYDLLKDPQRIMSQIERGQLDSLAQAINPVTEVVQGMVNMQDFINPEVAGIRRVRAIGQTNTVMHRFVGPDTLPVLAYYGDVIEGRTGRSQGPSGLDDDVLQSTTPVAAKGIVDAHTERIELIARIFAETFLRPLFKLVLGIVVEHQDKPRMVRIGNRFVEVDPRAWNADKDVTINVAIGAGSKGERLEVLAGIANKQQELINMGSPLASNVELRNTLAEMTLLGGHKNVEKFWKKWGMEEETAMQQAAAQQPPPPSPEMALVEVEKMKAQTDAIATQRKAELEEWKARQSDDLERDRLAIETELKVKEMELAHAVEINRAQLDAMVKRERHALDADIKREQAAQPETPAA